MHSIDLAVIKSACGNVSVFPGRGDGTYPEAPVYGIDDEPQAVVIEDLDGDGVPDLAISHPFGYNISIFLGNGDGTFNPAVFYGAGPQPQFVAVGDLDLDGRPDLVVANPAILLFPVPDRGITAQTCR